MKSFRIPPKKKPKLKKGQKIVFQEKEYNPFEEIANADTNPK
jgi:hypothetical protein